MPEFRLSPDFVLLGVLPPLVYTTALESSYLNLRDSVRSLTLLSVGLVLFTAAVVAGTVRLVVPGLPLAAALALGAILAPTDAVSAASIGRRLHLPRRLLTVITGESMLNDGTALTVYKVAVSAAAGTATLSLLSATGSLLAISAGGVAVGLILGMAIHVVRMRLRDPLAESALSLVAPFTAYLAAESLHVSGILAVVVAGLYLGHHAGQAHFATRLQDVAVWRVATFVLESVAFALIGFQLRPIIRDLAGHDPGRLVAEAAIVLGVVVVARIVWVFPAIYLPRWLVPRLAERDPSPPWQTIAVLSWAGMRGVISLAAAAALPSGVPQRNLLIFLTFCTVLGTLLVQGLTLPLPHQVAGRDGGRGGGAGRHPRRGSGSAGRLRGGPAATGGAGRHGASRDRGPAAQAGAVPAVRRLGAAQRRPRRGPRGSSVGRLPAAAPRDDHRRARRLHPAEGRAQDRRRGARPRAARPGP